MRMAALVLGCIGGGLLIPLGLVIAAVHPYGLVFVLGGAFGVAGAITARTNTEVGGGLLITATVLSLAPLFVKINGVRWSVYFGAPEILLGLAMIFFLIAPTPDKGPPR